jgi:hypothetical protein
MLVSEGKGPAVSLGVTAQAALVDEVAVAVEEVEFVVGLVELDPHPKAAPRPAPLNALRAIRLSIRFLNIASSFPCHEQSDGSSVKEF